MRLALLTVLAAALGLAGTCAAQDLVVKGYPTKLVIDEPIEPGADRTITGDGAPEGDGIWVELWRVPQGTHRAASVASVGALGGTFAFEHVDVAEGDRFFVTLSRSWQFEEEGNAEGWDGAVNDAVLTVEEGVLKVELANLNGDQWLDPFFQIWFDYDPQYYRVVEVRFKNPVPPPGVWLGLFWGAPWGETISEHNAAIPTEMDAFQTILIPMGMGERKIVPAFEPDVDGLWATGALNNTLRIDPDNNIPADDFSLVGEVFEIDYVRIREDLRWEFHDDVTAIDQWNDIDDLDVADGFLTYVATDVGSVTVPGDDGVVDPHFFRSLEAGYLDTEYFTHVVIGYDNPQVAQAEGAVGVFFDDLDSVGYWDDGGPPGDTVLQEGNAVLPYTGRVDGAAPMNDLTPEWGEDNRVHSAGLRLDLPQAATEGDRIAIDYFGFTPAEPYGPSGVVQAGEVPPPEPRFLRADTDGDGVHTIGDGIQILERLFTGRAAFGSECEDTGDADDTGVLTIGDAIIVFNYLFGGAAPPAPPGPDACGTDPTTDDTLGDCHYPEANCPG